MMNRYLSQMIVQKVTMTYDKASFIVRDSVISDYPLG